MPPGWEARVRDPFRDRHVSLGWGARVSPWDPFRERHVSPGRGAQVSPREPLRVRHVSLGPGSRLGPTLLSTMLGLFPGGWAL